MVVAVQQPLAECTDIFTMCVIIEHRPPPCTVTILKTCTDQQWTGFQDQKSMCWQHTKRFDQHSNLFQNSYWLSQKKIKQSA